MPRIGPSLIARFVSEPPRARAVYGGRPGHPVVLGPEELVRLGELHGDVGARELLAGGRLIDCSDLGASIDVDTVEDLKHLSL
jgi:CTP:molybdopterin cytidylyltransferase MocA